MPVHDWTRVDASIFHAFHHGWISEISGELNRGILPPQYYALIENGNSPDSLPVAPRGVRLTAETDTEYYRRKQSHIAVRKVSGDSVVAIVEVVSPSNKASRTGLRSLVEKVAEFLERRVHVLIIDLLPPTPRDPQGIHGVIWQEIAAQDYYQAPAGKPLTLVACKSAPNICAYVEPLRTGSELASMPLFMGPDEHLNLSLEGTYTEAFAAMPRRWRTVLEKSAS